MFCVLLDVLCEIYNIIQISLAASIKSRTYVCRVG